MLQSNRLLKPNSVSFGEVLQAHRRQQTVRNGNNGAIQRPNARRTHSDIFDRSKELARPAHVPHADWLVRNHHDAPEQVLDRFLRAEANGQAADTQTGERGSEIDIRKIKKNQSRDDHARRFQEAVDQEHQRRVARPMDLFQALEAQLCQEHPADAMRASTEP